MNLSIVIPVYNSEAYLERCLQSILRQNLAFNEFEILLIDDASTDSSLKICTEYDGKYLFIKTYSIPKSGVSSARNFGIHKAKGRYVFFMDSDDYIKNDSLAPILETAIKNDLDILGFYINRTKNEEGFLTDYSSGKFDQIEILDGKSYLKNDYYYKDSSCWYIVKKSHIIQNDSKFCENIIVAEDLLFNVTLFLNANRVSCIPMNVYQYVINPSSVWNDKSDKLLNKKIDDFIAVSIKFDLIIKKTEDNDLIKRLNLNKNILIRNTLKRIFESKLSINEIQILLDKLTKAKLFPLPTYIPENLKQIKTGIINFSFKSKTRFLFCIYLSRRFQKS